MTDTPEIQSALIQADALARVYTARPSFRYEPGRSIDIDGNAIDPRDNGQLQFHKAPHVIRLLAPGNGWGKTAALAVEVDWWAHGDHPYQQTPPLTLVWVCRTYKQWEIIRKDIEIWWPRHVVNSWVAQPRYSYTWANGSTLHIITAETDWAAVQGIQPHLVTGDETFPAAMWRELIKRRRGERRTRYNLGATQTEGLTWMASELYAPWKQWHEKQGIMDELTMMRTQGHRFSEPGLENLPGIWCWPQGSHASNPTATKETMAFYLATTKGSPAERHVRLYGGFRDFAGSPVFDAAAIERQRAGIVEGRMGVIVEEEKPVDVAG